MNRRINLNAMLLAALLLAASYLPAKDSPALVLHGEIMDSQCAYNVHSLGHSHAQMVSKNIGGATDEKSCTLHCVKDKGGVYVLMVKKEIYRLDDQNMPEQFAGKKVKVTGTLDEKTRTLHVLKMEEDR